MGTITKKVTLAAALATIVLPLPVRAQVQKLEEEQCLLFGRYAEHVAEGIRLGISEKQMLAVNLADESTAAETTATMNSIVSFVFMNKSGPELRKIVYLKCKAGEYDSAPTRKR